MTDNRKKVLIFGAGPAGLTAGIHLLENGGSENLDVTIVNLDHMLGGKAKSWKDPVFNDGRYYDHGIHYIFGYYKDLRELMAKAGIVEETVLNSTNGNYYWYEMRDKKVHPIRMPRSKTATLVNLAVYDGFTMFDRLHLTKFGLSNSYTLFLKKDISELDDICFKAFLVENGLSYKFATTSTVFRFTQDAFFVWPFEISAYASIVAIRNIFSLGEGILSPFSFKDTDCYLVKGGWSEHIWNPIGEYYKKLGGQFEFGRKLVGLKHDGKRITGLETGKSAPSNGSQVVPIAPGSEELISDFDYVISTLPMNCFRELNPDDKNIWNQPYFSSMRNLTGVVPIGLFAFFKEDLKYPYKAQINGLEPPLFNAVDYKAFCVPYKGNKKFGSVIHMQGQETGFEHLSDKEMVEVGLDSLSRLKGFEGIKKATLEHYYLYRGNKNHSRFLLTDPGTYKFRPKVKSPFNNLYLAGDWTQTKAVIPCMEGAMQSGVEAADYVLEACGLGSEKNA